MMKSQELNTYKPLIWERKSEGSNSALKPFSFVHAADLHLGYAQYGLEARRQDFDNAFKEVGG